MLLKKFSVNLSSLDKWWYQIRWNQPSDYKAASTNMIKQSSRWRVRHKIATRERLPHFSEILQWVVNKTHFPFHWTIVAWIIPCSPCWRRVSNIKVSVNVILKCGYYWISLQIFLVGFNPTFHLRVIGAKSLDNVHKWGVVQKIPQAMAGDGFEISVKLAGDGGMQSPGGNWLVTNNRNCSLSTPFLHSLSHTFVWKIANLAVMACLFSRAKTAALLSSWWVLATE